MIQSQPPLSKEKERAPLPAPLTNQIDIIVFHGELGYMYTYANVGTDKKISFIQECIQKDTKIEIANQFLTSKTGFRIQTEDVIGEIERDNALTQTQKLVETNKFKTFYTIYVFNEKHLMDITDASQNFFLMEQANQINLFNKITPDAKKPLKLEAKFAELDYQNAMELTEDQKALVQQKCPNILDLEQKLFKYYTSLKKKTYEYTQKQQRVDRACKEFENQFKSIESLLMRVINEYQISKQESNKLHSKIQSMNDHVQKSVQIYDESIKIGKTLELPEALKKENKKYVFDIYHDVAMMDQWKQHCLNKYETIKKQHSKETEEISQLKRQIKEQQLNISSHMTQTQEITKKYDDICSEGKNQIVSSFKGAYDEYKNVKNCIQYILEGKDDYTLKNALESSLTSSQEKLKDQEKVEKLLNQFIDTLSSTFSQIWEIKLKYFQKMQQFQQKFTSILSCLNKITYDKIKAQDGLLNQLDREVSDITRPYKFVTNFKYILKEISRRNEFNSLYEKHAKILNSLIRIESQKRSIFLQSYGRCMPKDFIPELHSSIKAIAENFERLPKIENEHDDKDKYSELFKQLELPEFALKQEERISELKRELQVNAINGKPRKDPHTMELEQQNSELRGQIIKLKNDIDMINLKKKDENASQQSDLQNKKNKILQERVQQLESQISQINNTNEYVKEIASLQKQLDERDKAYQNLFSFYSKEKENVTSSANQIEGSNAVNKSEDAKTIEKQNARIFNLTTLLQQSAKISFNQIFRKTTDKQQKLENKLFQQDQKLITNQEDYLKEKNKYIAFHEEKIKQTEQRYYQENKKITLLLDQTKEQYKDELNNLNSKIKQLDGDLAEKSKQLRNAQEQIARLNSQINQKQKEYEELNKKSQQAENRIIAENTKQVTELQNQLQKEQEKNKKKIGQLETDLVNKQTVYQNQSRDLAALKRELDLKNEEYEKEKYELNQTQNERERLKKDISNYKNKMDNMNQTIETQRLENQSLTKQNQILSNEKASISDDIQKDKQQVQDLQKRLQTIIDSVKQLENERSRLISQIDNQKLELDKKKIEIDNLNKQVYEQSNERTQQLEKLMESQMSEKLKITDLNEQVQIYKIELDQQRTKMQILETDLQARDDKIKILNKNIENQKSVIEENEKKIESLIIEQTQITADNEQKNQMIKQLNTAIEQALIEVDIQQKNASQNLQQLEEKQDEYSHEMERLQNEIQELTRNISTCKERERETNSKNVDLIQQIEDVTSRLNEKEQEISQIIEEMTQNKNTFNLKEMSLKKLNIDLREKDDNLTSLQEELTRVSQQLEDAQREEQYALQEIENLNSQIKEIKEAKSILDDKNLEQKDQIKDLLQSIVDLQTSLQQQTVEKELADQNNTLLKESLQKEESEKQKAIRCQDELAQQYESLKNNTICLDVHTQALEKLELEMQQKEQQMQEIVKEQGILAQELITAETTLKNQKKQIDTHKLVTEKYISTITELTAKLNVEKKDSECQWEEEQDEKMISLSTYEAQKFRKLLKSIDHNKKVPVMSQKHVEHIDLTQALKKTSLIQDSINFTRLEEGTKMLFIPSSENIYVPLILKQLNEGAVLSEVNTSESNSSLLINTYKNNYFLDFDTLDRKFKDLLTECSLIMVANIKNIIPKLVNIDNNPFGLKENESYFLLQVEQPEYIVGLEDEDHSIKNYA